MRLIGFVCVVVLLVGASVTKAENDLFTPLAIQKRIVTHRTAEATLTVAGPDGKPLANVPVVIRQTRHKFLFGSNGFRLVTGKNDPGEALYRKHFASLFNYTTLPFYWGRYEWTRGNPDLAGMRAMVKWCMEHNVRVKGHPLCWHRVTPRWAVPMTPDQALPVLMDRIHRDVAAYAGQVDVWDVVNEPVVMPTFKEEPGPIPALCKKLGTVELIKKCFAEARKANPSATLVINDYIMDKSFVKIVKDCLDAGVPIDAIGLQSHMHTKYWGKDWVWATVERFAHFGKPVHFTEATIISGDRNRKINWNDQNPRESDWVSTPEGEKLQAKQVEEFYTVLFSHPAVEAITWWDFSDAGAWLGAPGGLLRKDMSPKPAYDVLMRLIKKEWWTGEVKATTDAKGVVHFRGFLGDYSLQCAGGTATFTLDKSGAAALTAKLAKSN